MFDNLARLVPGVLLAAAISLAATVCDPLLRAVTDNRLALPVMVLALVIGMSTGRLAALPNVQPGLTFCVKTLLRYAIALLGVKIALSDIAGLGLGPVAIVTVAMSLTLALGLGLAPLLGLNAGYGALAGAANAVCGASATLASATVVPDYPEKAADIAFTVVAANVASTIVMLAYPPLSVWLGHDAETTGLMLGATIHDMAQVAGAGYAMSEVTGNTAVVVKLFRVLLLLPVVLALGFWFARRGKQTGKATAPAPLFAVGFIGLCVVNSIAPSLPGIAPAYAMLKPWLSGAASVGLLLAIAALGAQTSLTALARVGWRHLVLFSVLTTSLLATVTLGLALVR